MTMETANALDRPISVQLSISGQTAPTASRPGTGKVRVPPLVPAPRIPHLAPQCDPRLTHPATRAPPRAQPASGRPATTSIEGMKEALTETLVKKMRAKFDAKDVAVQDIIGEEVVAFMMQSGSVRETEIAALEARIKDRVLGQRAAGRRFDPNGVKDEWAEISKFKAMEGVRIEAERLAKKKADQAATRAALAEQMAEKEAARRRERDAVVAERLEQERRLEEWKSEELAKMAKRHAVTEKLKDDRREQLADKRARLAAQMEAKRREEEDLRRALAAEYRRRMVEEAENKARIAAEVEKLKASNEETLRLREEQARKEEEDDLMYQRLYAERLAKQEAEYLANLEKMKAKQNSQMAATQTLLSHKRYMPDEVIERNAAAHDREAEEREARDAARRRDLDTKTRRALAEQIKFKQERLDRERAEETRRHQRFARVVNTLEDVEKTEQAEARARRVAHLRELEAQMRDNVERRQVFPMTATEKALNSGLLERVATMRAEAQ